MIKNIFSHNLMVLFVLLNSLGIRIVSENATEPKRVSEASYEISPASTYSEMSVTLSTPTHSVISFNASETEETPASEIHEIPHLVLKRNGVLTPGYERTLEIVANNVPVYAPGIFVVLTITTQHRDPDSNRKAGNAIQVWSDRQFVPYTELTQQGVRLSFSAIFNRFTALGETSIPTPTDYFKYKISIVDMNGNLRQSHTKEYAFLMESQWRVPLPRLLESEPGAAPNRLLVYYYDMVPFQADMRDPTSQIPREGVERYIQTELIPNMIQAIQTQSNDWEFTWYPEWRNFRRDEDPKTLSVALGESGIWFHGIPPALGHSMISIRVDGTVGEYDNLTDGLMSVFHHELFHNHQRNIAVHFSGQANVAGQDEAWKMFSEGTAVLASAVGQPELQFAKTAISRSYFKRANSFIGSDGIIGGGLNKSYKNIPYHTAAYWRFLYEKCGGITSAGENPAEGMKVIRSTLETLYKSRVVDPNASAESVESLPALMDNVLASTPKCPFRSYEESLSQFAKTIYMLRISNGRCPDSNIYQECGLYDPNNRYATPPAENMHVTDEQVTYLNGDIGSSFGIDIVEIHLDTSINGKSISIMFDRAPNSMAEYTVEVVRNKTSNTNTNTIQPHQQIGTSILLDARNGHVTFDINSIDTSQFDCLGLVITRVDTQEKLDDMGSYTIRTLVQ